MSGHAPDSMPLWIPLPKGNAAKINYLGKKKRSYVFTMPQTDLYLENKNTNSSLFWKFNWVINTINFVTLM